MGNFIYFLSRQLPGLEIKKKIPVLGTSSSHQKINDSSIVHRAFPTQESVWLSGILYENSHGLDHVSM